MPATSTRGSGPPPGFAGGTVSVIQNPLRALAHRLDAIVGFRVGTSCFGQAERGANMLEMIAVVLLVLWVLGLVSSYTLGGFIHLLLVVAVIVILIRVIQGRRI